MLDSELELIANIFPNNNSKFILTSFVSAL